MIKSSLLILLNLIFIGVCAQAPESSPPQLRVAYLGSLLAPGMKVGLMWPRTAPRRVPDPAAQPPRLNRSRYRTLSLGGYHQRDFHTHFWLQAEWVRRWQRPGGWWGEWAPGLGVSRTFLPHPTFTVGDDGQVRRRRGAGHFFALGTISGAIGYDWAARNGGFPGQVFLKPTLMALFPFNRFFLLKPTLELGVIYPLR